MHIYFSGIGGTGLGPLALIAKQAGYSVSGSDKQDSLYISYLNKHGISNIHIGQSYHAIAEVHKTQPIDWLVYTTAVTSEQQEPEELEFCKNHRIKVSKRDELLNYILDEKELEMIAIAGTHGKTTTTAMMIWLLQQLNIPASHSVGAKIPFGDMGHYEPGSKYFVYEADEYARNFLSFFPRQSLIVGIDYDHADIYPTRKNYEEAFTKFISQSEKTLVWQSDISRVQPTSMSTVDVLDDTDDVMKRLTLIGEVNRRNAWQVIYAAHKLLKIPVEEMIQHMNRFPGLSRRFEKIETNIYTDYAHTPPKIRGALQTAQEVAGANVVVVYEGLHNTRQHFILAELKTLFDNVKKLYVVPSYLAREDESLELLTPDRLRDKMSLATQSKTVASELNDTLKKNIKMHAQEGDLVLCLTAGGGGSLDEWMRTAFTPIK